MLEGVTDAICLITGATSGIGKACAKLFFSNGAKVILTGRREKEGTALARELDKKGNRAIFCRADMARECDIDRLFMGITSMYGHIDIAINNAAVAGITHTGIHDFSNKEWHKIININLNAVFLCMKQEISLMLNAGGSIVNVSSVGGLRAGKINAAYTASKHGVIGLTKAAAVEYAKQKIRINAVCPAFIDTPMLSEELKRKALDFLPMQRCGSAKEVAESIFWLCSRNASFITGITLPVDGGMLA